MTDDARALRDLFNDETFNGLRYQSLEVAHIYWARLRKRVETVAAARLGAPETPAPCPRCNGAEVDTYMNPESPTGYTERPCPACKPAGSPVSPGAPETPAICETCQMRLPERLVTYGIGVRGGAAARCAACSPQDGADGEATSGHCDAESTMKKPRYRLHWAAGSAPKPALKWVIYDWKLICPVAYTESRVGGRKLCAFLNEAVSGGTEK